MNCSLELERIKIDFLYWVKENPVVLFFTLLTSGLVSLLAYSHVPYHVGMFYGPFSVIALVLQAKRSKYLYHPVMFLGWMIIAIYEVTQIFII